MSIECVPLLSPTKPTTEEENDEAIDDLHKDHRFETSIKSIGSLGSFALIINNLTGPAMLGFPNLFQQAGILPVVSCTVIVCVSASLCGTMLAESIASLPGNADFSQMVDFSSAFRLCVGEDWYVIAETLFLMSCAVQACAALVEAAQSLDGFLASFLLGRTYALQFFPSLEVVSWSPALCHSTETQLQHGTVSGLDDCTPFHDNGPIVLSLGFLLVTMLFLPLGRGHLKETILVQLLSFFCMFALLTQFSTEFVSQGFNHPLPLIGSDLTNLAGVVLFNFAYSITVPAWLNEKQPHVSVNRTIWGSNVLASGIYIAFGVMGAMTFQQVGPNLLVLLASNKVHYLTRICAAVFGVTIIGCGVPVFCVIIKTALYTNNVCDSHWALFWGAYAPYLVSWLLYQGSILMTVLNWTGLVINGLVAFILPMVLAYRCLDLKSRQRREREKRRNNNRQQPSTGQSSQSYDMLSTVAAVTIQQDCEVAECGVEMTARHVDVDLERQQGSAENSGISGIIAEETSSRRLGARSRSNSKASPTAFTPLHSMTTGTLTTGGCDDRIAIGGGGVVADGGTDFTSLVSERIEVLVELETPNSVQALPPCLEGCRRPLVLGIIAFFALIISFTIFVGAISGSVPDPE